MQLRVGRLMRGLTGLIRFGGLIGIHASARVSVRGTFVFGKRVSVGRNSIIQIPRDATLSLGDGVYIGREVEVTPTSEITIGNFTSVQDRCNILGQISIGANCVFAPNVFLSSGTHRFMERPAWLIRDQDALVRDPGYEPSSPRHLPIQVQDDCWIGVNVVVMRGVTIGRGSVVGANSVVTKSVRPYTVVAGAPAQPISRRLEFNPPRAITSSDPDALPYFYSGFDLRQRTIFSSPRGLKAHGRFEVAIDCQGSSSIQVEIELDKPANLTFRGQNQILVPGLQNVSFRLDGPVAGGLISMEASDMRGLPCTVTILRVSAEH